MARTKEYDKNKALNNALILFWTHGYSATSIQQLCAVMEMSRSSIYEEFGNKRDLFIESMSHYTNSANILIDVIIESETPELAIRKFYDVAFIEPSDKLRGRGCLLVHTILELREVDQELSNMASDYFEKLEKAFVTCFKKCALEGNLKSGLDPRVVASFILTLVKGLRVSERQGANEAYLRGVIETSLLVFKNY